ncbi:MAG: UDP-2,3-diacylglucosamine diphosphatase LpxI [Myxococcota bacterium]|nr:UDP-2,3-diacylglucosamine diphosphatase LpxI [Myxococcota bacterium]
MSELLGLIAGDGDFPQEIASAAARRGCRVHAVGFHGLTRPELSRYASECNWHHLGQVDAVLEDLRQAGVRSLVMAGKIEKTHLTSSRQELLETDARADVFLQGLQGRSDRTIMKAIAGLLEREGFSLRPQTEYVPDLIAQEGALGQVLPTDGQRADLAYGWPIARQLADAGVGQCLVVKDQSVVAVEAAEGTDQTIRRAVQCAGGGLTIIKLAALDQDPRFDMPAVGPLTLEPLLGESSSLLAIEAGKTVVLHRETMAKEADSKQIAIWAVGRSEETAFDGGGGKLQS